MTSPNTETLLRLIELAEKATPGEWRFIEEDTDSGLNPDWFVQAAPGKSWDNIAACGNDAWEDDWEYTREQRKANAEFIAAARNAIPALKSLLQAQGAEPEACRRQAVAFIEKHRRHVQASPGVGKERQDYAIATLDDVASDIERHMVVRAPPLAESVGDVDQQVENWKETAAFHCRNELFYRGLITQIGEMFGKEAYISDDGSVQQDVLALKVPELVAELLRKHVGREG